MQEHSTVLTKFSQFDANIKLIEDWLLIINAAAYLAMNIMVFFFAVTQVTVMLLRHF